MPAQKSPTANLTKGILYGLLSALLVGGYVLINRYVYVTYHVQPFPYTATFMGAAGVFAAIGLLVRHITQPLRIARKDVPGFILLGAAGGLAVGLVVFGQRYTTAVNAGIIFTSTIITTTLFARYMLRESLTRVQYIWLGIMFVGLYFGIVGLHLLRFNTGDLIILSAAIAFGFSNTYSKILMRRQEPNVVADARLMVSGLLFLALGFIVSGGAFAVTNAGLWPLASGLSFWLGIRAFYSAVQHAGANRAIVLNNSQLVFTAIVGVVLLAEPYSLVKGVASVVVLLSVYFITKK